jgi:ATP-binding cassette subfamily F protein 3
MDSRAALVEGLNDFEGTLILISHDRRLVETTCDQLWLVQEGQCTQYFDDMLQYRQMLLGGRSKVSEQQAAGEVKKSDKKQSRKDAANSRAALAPLKKRAKEAEARLDKAMSEKEKINSELSEPDIYDGPADRVISLTARLSELDKVIEEAENEWIDAAGRLEEAQNKF